VLAHEKNNTLFFSSLQSSFAKTELARHGYDFSTMNTLVLVYEGKILYKSDAALDLCKFLKAPYSWALALKIFPRFIRDSVYDLVSRNRKKWFKKEFCCVVNPEQKKRFLD
jgi:predicted DCC family thiol-disulfide oxidoreductase YuxK